MDKQKLDRWESAFLWDGINHQINMVEKHIKEHGEPKHITDGECDVLQSLVQKIVSSFWFNDDSHWDIIQERIKNIPRMRTPMKFKRG